MIALDDATREKLAGRRVVASVSGGKDSAAMSLWLTENGVEHDRVFADTAWEHQVTYDYLRGPLAKALGPIQEVQSSIRIPCPCGRADVSCRLCRGSGILSGMLALILHKGMFPSRVRRFCTQELKVFPLAEYVKKAQDQHGEVVNSVGIRAEESEARSKVPEWEWQETFDCDVWRPLLRWTFDDVVEIHRRHGLAPNPLYLRGASRVGCWPCIYARKEEVRLVADLDDERIALIRELEAHVDAGRRQRALDRDGTTPGFRASFFGMWKPDKKTRECASIDEMVSWSRTAHGGKNLSLFQPGPDDEGCMRWGLCEQAPPPSQPIASGEATA